MAGESPKQIPSDLATRRWSLPVVEPLLFELTQPGNTAVDLPALDVPPVDWRQVLAPLIPRLPQTPRLWSGRAQHRTLAHPKTFATGVPGAAWLYRQE